MDILIFSACFIIISAASKQIGQSLVKTGLPLISGFLLTGIIAGPYVLNLIPEQAALNLKFVDEISLGFIAFAAGGELYLKELKNKFKSILWITTGLVISTFCLTSLAFFMLTDFIPFLKEIPVMSKVGISILAGAIMVARSPSSAIAIINELRARGTFTQTILGVTIISDVVVIILFAANSSIADALFAGVNLNFFFIVLLAIEIGASLLTGYLVSKIILLILKLPVYKFIKAASILLTGYLVFMFSMFIRKTSHDFFFAEILLEPLLICMIAGFLVSNTSKFRKEFLKILFDIGPPVYIAFFTLTGVSLSLDILFQVWPVTLALLFVRIVSIFTGAFIGGTLAKNPVKHNTLSWMTFITQAGVSLGLAKEVAVEFPEWGNSFATIIISVIILNQVIGPILFKFAIKLTGEDHTKARKREPETIKKAVIFGSDNQASALAMSLMSQGWEITIALQDADTSKIQNPDLTQVQINKLDLAGLRKIDCHHASAIVCMLSDEQNYKICETAYEHFGTQTLIARLNNREHFSRFQAIGVLIVDPSTAIVSLLDHFVRAPAAASLLMGMHTDRHVIDLSIKNPNLFGLALRDLRLPFDSIIMSIRRRGVLFVPHDFTRLEAGDRVTVIGTSQSLEQIALRFDVNQDQALAQIIEKATAKELGAPSIQRELKDMISAETSNEKDRFDYLAKESLVMDLKDSMHKEDFFKVAAKTMSGPLNISPSAIEELLIKREEEVSTVLAPGLAIPHIIVEGENKFCMLLVRCKKGIEFSQLHPPVYAVFVLAGTRDERKFHLRALSAIAQIVMNPRFEKKWLRARNANALKNVLLNAERKRSA